MANVEDEIEALELQFETKMLACSVKTLRKLADGDSSGEPSISLVPRHHARPKVYDLYM